MARVLRPQGMFLACEWGRSVASVRDMNSLPKTHRYFRELNRCLDGFGIRPIATHMVAYVTQSGLFYNVSAAVYLIPVGGGHDPCNQYLGWQFFDVMLQYADATKTIMLQAGYTEHRVDELVIGLEEEMRAAQGMFFEYYTVHARKLQV